ncbi:uncharacterized protein [Henckelia pumila]|uniref:uncharacterized protein n=1 Tax=Henckelia pumila TaxID=405737 RepID=UPI003C6E2DE8
MGESLHEYWKRFKKLCASCPQHLLSKNILIQYCYECLLPHDTSMLDEASGGVFVDKTPQDARILIENMVVNSQQFGTSRGNGQNMKVCGICTTLGHPTDMCPTLQAGSTEKFNATGGFPGPPQQNYDPYANTYIPVLNPKENVSAIPLRSGKELKVREEVVQAPIKNEDEDKSKVEENEPIQEDAPKALKESRKYEGIKELYDTFRRCEVNIPLLDTINQRKISAKCKHPGMFSIPCKIGDVQLDTAMLDLGESINVMSYSTYAFLKLEPLNETTIVIQMADRSTIYPRGVIEDVLVKVGNSASKTESKLPPDRAKEIPMGKGKNHKEIGIPKKSKKRKHQPKLNVKILKLVKVDKGIRYELP